MNEWRIYEGTTKARKDINIVEMLGEPPDWRNFTNENLITREIPKEDQFQRLFGKRNEGKLFSEDQLDIINAALYLRRPLFISGKPGCGKSSLPYAVAHELQLGKVLKWPITTRSTLQEGLYNYDAIARLRDIQIDPKQQHEIGKYLRLGPLGTALLPTSKPRVLLIDEIDKSDIDLPNDLLNIFEEGEFNIPEIARSPKTDEETPLLVADSDLPVNIKFGKVYGQIQCNAFPFIVMTSNGEKTFPPAFLRRCLRLDIDEPTPAKLAEMVESHLPEGFPVEVVDHLCKEFIRRRESDGANLATDQLLNAVYLFTKNVDPLAVDKNKLCEALFRNLSYDQKDS